MGVHTRIFWPFPSVKVDSRIDKGPWGLLVEENGHVHSDLAATSSSDVGGECPMTYHRQSRRFEKEKVRLTGIGHGGL